MSKLKFSKLTASDLKRVFDCPMAAAPYLITTKTSSEGVIAHRIEELKTAYKHPVKMQKELGLDFADLEKRVASLDFAEVQKFVESVQTATGKPTKLHLFQKEILHRLLFPAVELKLQGTITGHFKNSVPVVNDIPKGRK